MPLRFHLHSTQDKLRRATLHLPHGTVETPVFMPVGTQATVKAVQQQTLETLGEDGTGAQIILANTYHLYLRPGHDLIARLGGLHKFMSWHRPMLTDSGGFQVFSLAALRRVTPDGVEFRSHLDGSKHFFSPEHSMDVQIALGADICMAFDECTEHPATRTRTEQSMALTHAWAQRSLTHFRANTHRVPWHSQLATSNLQLPTPNSQLSTDNVPLSTFNSQSLYGIVQGGMYPDLRAESVDRLLNMRDTNGNGFDGYAIGGLAVGEPREVTQEIIEHTLSLLPADKPRYVMGVGYPDEIVAYARLGVDQMDCVLPTRAARHALLFTSEGRLNIRNQQFAEDTSPPDPACHCPTCTRYTRAYLRHLFHTAEPLAATLATTHNLTHYLNLMHHLREELTA